MYVICGKGDEIMSEEIIPIEQQSGAWNRIRQRRNLAIVRAMMEKERFDPSMIDSLKGSVEVSVIQNGKASGLRYHLSSRKESSYFHGEHRS